MKSGVTAILFLVALLFVLFGQAYLPNAETTQQGVAYVGTAVFIFLIGLFLSTNQTDPLEQPWQPQNTPRRPLLSLSPVARLTLTLVSFYFAWVAFANLANNEFTRSGTLAWFASLAYFVAIFAEYPGDLATVRSWRPAGFHLLLLGVFLLAAFFRFYHLDILPLDTWSDQAEKLLDVNDVLNGMRPIFFPRNTGREAFQFYLTAVLIWYTPLEFGYFALKVGTALTGLFTLPWVYLLGRELYGRHVALIACVLFAISHWHVTIARVGLRFPFTAAFAAPTLYFLFRAFKYNRRNDWLACGLFLGVGLHTYIPMRMVPLLLIVLVAIKLTADLLSHFTHQVSRESSALTLAFWQNAVLGGITNFLVFLPLLRYSYDQPEMFWYRASSRTGEVSITAESWHILLDNIKNALLMFNYRGDTVVTNTIPFSPQLDIVTGALFILGVVYLLWRWLRYGDRRSVYLLISCFVMLLPSILSIAFPNENPSVVRTGGAIPLVMIMAALPFYLIGQTLSGLKPSKPSWQVSKLMAGVITAVLLTAAIFLNYHWYFIRYDAHYRNTAWNTTEMGQLIKEFVADGGDLAHTFHVPFPYWVDTRLIGLHAGDITWNNTFPDTAEAWVQVNDPAPKLFLLHIEDRDNLLQLQGLFPTGQAQRYFSAVSETKDFMLFYVPPKSN